MHTWSWLKYPRRGKIKRKGKKKKENEGTDREVSYPFLSILKAKLNCPTLRTKICFTFILEVKNSILCHWQCWLQREEFANISEGFWNGSIRNERVERVCEGLFEEWVSCLPTTAFSTDIPLGPSSPTTVSLLPKHCRQFFLRLQPFQQRGAYLVSPTVAKIGWTRKEASPSGRTMVQRWVVDLFVNI